MHNRSWLLFRPRYGCKIFPEKGLSIGWTVYAEKWRMEIKGNIAYFHWIFCWHGNCGCGRVCQRLHAPGDEHHGNAAVLDSRTGLKFRMLDCVTRIVLDVATESLILEPMLAGVPAGRYNQVSLHEGIPCLVPWESSSLHLFLIISY